VHTCCGSKVQVGRANSCEAGGAFAVAHLGVHTCCGSEVQVGRANSCEAGGEFAVAHLGVHTCCGSKVRVGRANSCEAGGAFAVAHLGVHTCCGSKVQVGRANSCKAGGAFAVAHLGVHTCCGSEVRVGRTKGCTFGVRIHCAVARLGAHSAHLLRQPSAGGHGHSCVFGGTFVAFAGLCSICAPLPRPCVHACVTRDPRDPQSAPACPPVMHARLRPHARIHAQVWRDALDAKASAPYMTHRLLDGTHLADAQFVPYEDVLGLGSSEGYSSIIVPGGCRGHAQHRTGWVQVMRSIVPGGCRSCAASYRVGAGHAPAAGCSTPDPCAVHTNALCCTAPRKLHL